MIQEYYNKKCLSTISKIYPSMTKKEKKIFIGIGIFIYALGTGVCKIYLTLMVFGGLYMTIGFERTIIIILSIFFAVIVLKNQKTFKQK